MQIEIITEKGKKGRSFRAELLSWVDAPGLFAGGATETLNHRPVWMAIASTSQETRAFTVNLRRGKIAQEVRNHSTGDRWQLLKTAGYHHHQRKIGGGVVTTFYLPSLFAINPGLVDPDEVKFVMLPSSAWLSSQLNEEDAEALLFLAYLDRRTRFPFPPEAGFARALLDRCFELKFATRGQSSYGGYSNRFLYVEHDFVAVGLPGGVGFLATQEQLGEVLAEQIKHWHEAH